MARRTAVLALGVAAALAATLPAAGASRHGATRAGFTTYQDSALASDAAEPSIGVSWKTGSVFLQAGLQTAKVTFSGGSSSWSDSSPFETSLLTLDPIGFTDDATGRLFVSQLTGFGSLMAYSDDDGGSWTASQGAGLPAGADHQTVGGGPYPAESGIRPVTTYPDAVYYCSQDLVTAFCARSDTGGLTFGAGVPIYTFVDCAGLHGHVKVAPDGTVYVPNSNCGGVQGVAVSTDAGDTWTVRKVPGSSSGDSDPSIGIGRDGTVYLVYNDSSGAVKVVTSRDHGQSWSKPSDVSAPMHLASGEFPAAVAGDGDRAAVAFLGTTTHGDTQDPAFGMDSTGLRYVGAEYHLYIATTYDRGRTWTTTDVTPNDPVQRGRICTGGTSCSGPDRNLLDFIDVNVDRQGRVLVGWADGCTGRCVSSTLVANNTYSDQGRVTRETSGLGLFRKPPPTL